MSTITPVDPKAVDQFGRGTKSRSIIDPFLEANVKMAKINDSRPVIGVRTSLTYYIRTHKLPIDIIQRGGALYLVRTDLDNEGNKINDGRS